MTTNISSGLKNKNLKILFAASEITPIAKVGGLGDVTGALPKALADLGVDVRLIMPFYGCIDRKKYKVKKLADNITVLLDKQTEKVSLWQALLPNTEIPAYLIEHDFFKSKEIYISALADSLNDIKRFSFFSQAILPSLEAINFQPDIIHLNDWHTAAVSGIIKTQKKNIKTLLTIHNLANQGKTKNHNLLAEGILNSDIVATVSPTYAKEILTEYYGAGLERILTRRVNQLYGILNGIDTVFFNPTTDKLIAENYSVATLNKKLENKLKLQKKLGLTINKKVALAGVVTRFVGQKGIKLITEDLLELDCQFVFLGTGEKKYEDALLSLAKKFPDKFSAQIKFDEKLAHEIYAASDIFLVPSRFEPCGLTQMIAMRYGSVPLVKATGGLKDTVNSKVGFTFIKFRSAALYETLEKALRIYYNKPKIFRQLQINGMKQDFSWDKSAKQYLKLYKKLAR